MKTVHQKLYRKMPISVEDFLNRKKRSKKISEQLSKSRKLALAIYIKCQHLQELALQFRQRRQHDRGNCRKILRWVGWKRSGFLTTHLSSAYFQFSYIFSISQQIPGFELLGRGNQKRTKFFFFRVYVNFEEGCEWFKPLQ